MNNPEGSINVIVKHTSHDFEGEEDEDRGGGDPHALKDWFQGGYSVKSLSTEDLKKGISSTMKQIEEALKNVDRTLNSRWKLDTISVGLSVSTEGSIGIASAGVETSIELSFSPEK